MAVRLKINTPYTKGVIGDHYGIEHTKALIAFNLILICKSVFY